MQLVTRAHDIAGQGALMQRQGQALAGGATAVAVYDGGEKFNAACVSPAYGAARRLYQVVERDVWTHKVRTWAAHGAVQMGTMVDQEIDKHQRIHIQLTRQFTEGAGFAIAGKVTRIDGLILIV